MPTHTRRRLTAAATTTAFAILSVGCSPAQPTPAPPPASSVEGGGANSCAAVFDYQGRRYSWVPKEDVKFDVAEQIGLATIPPCADGGPSQGGTPIEEQIPAYRIEGLDPRDAFAIGTPAKPSMVTVMGKKLPTAVEEFLEQNS